MKNASLALSALALVGVIVLFGMQMSGNKGNSANKATVATNANGGSVKIAYVDIDSLEANYIYLKNKKAEFLQRQQNMSAELERSIRQFENDKVAFQRKVQAGNVSEAEGQATMKRLAQMEESFYTRRETLTQTLLKEQDEFNKGLQRRLQAFLEDYNKDKGYDYVLSYSESGSILYKNSALNITQDVISGLNATAEADTSSKKK